MISFDLEPGDVTFHSLWMLHGTRGNSSSTVRRRAWTVRYVGDDVRWKTGRSFSTMDVDPGLEDGAPLHSPHFPEVWPR